MTDTYLNVVVLARAALASVGLRAARWIRDILWDW